MRPENSLMWIFLDCLILEDANNRLASLGVVSITNTISTETLRSVEDTYYITNIIGVLVSRALHSLN